MKTPLLLILTTLFCSLLFTNNAQSQTPWSEYDFSEMKLTYENSFGGYKMVRLVHFSQDSCFYEYRATNRTNSENWQQHRPLESDTISCSYFDSVRTQFIHIRNEDILLHMKNLVISDGFRISLALSNGNSSVTYQIHSPRKKDDHIQDFKETADLMLNLAGKSWNTWIK